MRAGIALALGLGAVPALGGTDLAKESLSWLAVPSAGLLLRGLAAVSALTVIELFAQQPARA